MNLRASSHRLSLSSFTCSRDMRVVCHFAGGGGPSNGSQVARNTLQRLPTPCLLS